ncbi:MAG TPA: AAA family ATPase [Methylomirabilota bacterium]|nr:AAA family ATPase [Methylomirabilota bacterium]
MANTTIEPSPVFGLRIRVESRPARRCPACRHTWPFDWDYCSHCNVWLPGTECSERRTLLVPTGTQSSISTAGVKDRLVLACQLECPGEQPRPEDLRRGHELLRSFRDAIAASGGTPRVVPDAGVTGSWSDDVASASLAARTALAGPRGSHSLAARRVRFGIGISCSTERQDPQRLAFRLGSLAGPDSILVCDQVYRRTRQRFDYRGVCPVVSRSEPLPGLVFELVGAKPERSGSRHAGPERAPLVGRRALLRALDRCRQDVESGQCVVVHLIGEPGSGKSKLVREWLAASAGERHLAGWLRLETDGVPYELLIHRIQWTLAHTLPQLERRHRTGLFTEGMRFALGMDREAILHDLDGLEERLASWLDRLDVVEGAAPALVRQFVEGLDAIDGRLARMSLLLGRQRPHCGRLAQALARLGAGRERAG